ncbi:PREDICTED: TNF receptor-associated factor 4 [Thamnophis sirtalis]|uniref:TNF receptor-associated factor n=1 Tax=Thamnophis sirtalis TaxID=35019 RepID=A0A6I9YJI3_9SAUR|nr:PREDICTED: TNF receptor-associated factor 4 [Thamnophis sirtalis]
MPGFDYKFLEKPKRRLLCPLCAKAMREPVRVSTCGHRFCDTCLQEFLRTFPTSHFLPPPGHFLVASHPPACPPESPPWKVPEANGPPSSPFPFSDSFCPPPFQNHQGVCPQESVYCENKCGARMMRRLLSPHMLAECPKRTQPCSYCAKEFLYDTIQNHEYQCPRYPVPCPNQCGAPNIAREDLSGHVKENCSTALALCPFREAGCKHRCPKVSLGRHLDENTKLHLGLMGALVARQRQELAELRREVEELAVGSDGVLIWKISDYGRKLQEARLRSNYESFSPPFYTHRYGYRLQVSVFLNGNGSGEGSHLSVYIRVLPGQYDNLLEWPFAYRVTFSLLDQSDPSLSKPQHITETFLPDPAWKNFQKPGTGRTSLDESLLGFGYPKFISHEDIKKRNYVRDNAVFLKASVEIPPKILS